MSFFTTLSQLGFVESSITSNKFNKSLGHGGFLTVELTDNGYYTLISYHNGTQLTFDTGYITNINRFVELVDSAIDYLNIFENDTIDRIDYSNAIDLDFDKQLDAFNDFTNNFVESFAY